MAIHVDPEKLRQHFRDHTDYDPDDPDQARAMRRAVLWVLVGSLPLIAGFVMTATTDLLPALSVLTVGALMIGARLSRCIALTSAWPRHRRPDD